MRTAAYKVDVASDRRRRENVPRHILYSASLETAAANVVGDGRKAIKELIALKNGHRATSRQLQLDASARRQLKAQALTPETVLQRDRKSVV